MWVESPKWCRYCHYHFDGTLHHGYSIDRPRITITINLVFNAQPNGYWQLTVQWSKLEPSALDPPQQRTNKLRPEKQGKYSFPKISQVIINMSHSSCLSSNVKHEAYSRAPSNKACMNFADLSSLLSSWVISLSPWKNCEKCVPFPSGWIFLPSPYDGDRRHSRWR